jgi:hypothetical protein
MPQTKHLKGKIGERTWMVKFKSVVSMPQTQRVFVADPNHTITSGEDGSKAMVAYRAQVADQC